MKQHFAKPVRWSVKLCHKFHFPQYETLGMEAAIMVTALSNHVVVT